MILELRCCAECPCLHTIKLKKVGGDTLKAWCRLQHDQHLRSKVVPDIEVVPNWCPLTALETFDYIRMVNVVDTTCPQCKGGGAIVNLQGTSIHCEDCKGLGYLKTIDDNVGDTYGIHRVPGLGRTVCFVCSGTGVVDPGYSTCRCGEHSTSSCKACKPDICGHCQGEGHIDTVK